ncbi:MAG: D-2-hydroxyacid dehydrogenase [Thermoanaerobaculia bacterium]
MTLEVLVPLHFVEELRDSAAMFGATLIGYDQDAVPVASSRDAAALFRWWLNSEDGDRIVREHPALRWVHTGSAGVDHILTSSFRASEITLTNSAGVHAPSIAEWVVAMLLAESKGLARIYRQQRERIWKVTRSDEIAGRHALILGGGHIAREIASRLRAMGVRVTAVTRRGITDDSFDVVASVGALGSLCGEADWLIVAAPLTAETRGLVSAAVLAALPSSAWIVNVARGEIVDEGAMLDALKDRRIAGAILDVFEREPLPPEHPFWAMESVRVLPHTTWRSEQVHARQMALFLDNLRRFARNEALRNIVDPARGY